MLSDAPFWRLVWKEYRTHRPLWLAILIGTPVLQFAMMLVVWMQTSSSVHDWLSAEMLKRSSNGLVSIAFVSLVAYLIGCVGTMFAIDHETGVFPFIRVLPTTQPRVFWSKIGFALVSWAALTFLIGLVTSWIYVPNVNEDASWYWTFGVLFLVEVFAWSLFSSLWIRQPLWAIVVALAGQALVISLVSAVLDAVGRNYGWLPSTVDRMVVYNRLLATLALLVSSVFCGRLWFEERLRLPCWSWRRENMSIDSYDLFGLPDVPRTRVQRSTRTIADFPPYLAECRASRSRLLWQSWRDARFVIVGIVGITMIASRHYQWLAVAYVASCFLCGILAFGLDQQQGRYRYFAERGCVPREVWFCRHAVWLSMVITLALIGCAFNNGYRMAATNSGILLSAWLCYGVGQFTAMLVRSVVVAFALGLALLFGGLMWFVTMSEFLRIPAWWSVGSIPAILLFVTWLKSNDWIEERRDRVARWRTRLGVAVPVAMLLIAIQTYRVVQIPIATLPAEWDAPRLTAAQLSATDRETLDIYRRALRVMDPLHREHSAAARDAIDRMRQAHPDWSTASVTQAVYSQNQAISQERWAEAAALLEEAHSRPAVPLAILQDELPLPDFNDQHQVSTSWLASAMYSPTRTTLAKGELDEAWREIEIVMELVLRSSLQTSRQYGNRFSSGGEPLSLITEWGRHPQQSRERIVAAIRRLETRETLALTFGLMAVQSELIGSRILLRLDPRWRDIPREVLDQGYGQQYPQQTGPIPAWRWTTWQWMFSERWRSERFLRWEAAMAVDSLRSIAAEIELGRAPQHPQPITAYGYAPVELYAPRDWCGSRLWWNNNLTALRKVTILPPTVRSGLATSVESQLFGHVTSLRATQLQLALADWYREHGSYPETLDELVPIYFDKLPLEPMRATPFGYFPKGLPQDVSYEYPGTPSGKPNVQVLVAKEIPFLWTSPAHAVYTPQRQPDGTWLFNNSGGLSNTAEGALRHCGIWQLPVTRAAER